jgi:hypothetical protein
LSQLAIAAVNLVDKTHATLTGLELLLTSKRVDEESAPISAIVLSQTPYCLTVKPRRSDNKQRIQSSVNELRGDQLSLRQSDQTCSPLLPRVNQALDKGERGAWRCSKDIVLLWMGETRLRFIYSTVRRRRIFASACSVSLSSFTSSHLLSVRHTTSSFASIVTRLEII